VVNIFTFAVVRGMWIPKQPTTPFFSFFKLHHCPPLRF